MSSPDPLARRMVRTEEDVQAIGDTVTETLTRVRAIQRKQREHDVALINVRHKVERLESSVAAVQQVQHEHSQVLAGHSQVLAGHSQVLAGHSQVLAEHSERLSSIEQRVSAGFTAIDERFTAIEERVTEGFAEILRRLDAR